MLSWEMATGGQKTIILFSASMITPFLIGLGLYYLFNPTIGLLVKNKEE